MIGFEKVSFSYPEREVIRDFSLVIPPGARIALMGPSGCGKTTLLRLLMGLERPAAGKITDPPRPEAAVFQEDRLLSHKTVLQNAAFAAHREKEAAALLGRLGLCDVLAEYPAALSGGMKRRVAIVRALCTPAPLLALDEPFNGLDGQAKRQTAALILSEWTGAILLVTHLEEEAALLGAQIVPLKAL